jgi:two-component system, LytTR family, sensor kinase
VAADLTIALRFSCARSTRHCDLRGAIAAPSYTIDMGDRHRASVAPRSVGNGTAHRTKCRGREIRGLGGVRAHDDAEVVALRAARDGRSVGHDSLSSRDGSLRRSVPVHSCASLAFSALHLAACVVVYGFLIEGMPNRFPFRFGVLVTVYLAIDLLVYWAIAGFWSAVHHDEMVRRRDLAAAELRSQLSQARLDALQAQLNPHFLFNTLNATIALARLGRQREVVSTLENLGELLQLTLDRRLPREVPLSREIALLERYLDIQLIRFGDRLRVSWEIAPETRNVHVPSMVLLPIVENALQHGIDVQPGAGSIRIRAIVDENALQIEVDDNGPGWRSGPTGHGIGLTNTRSRLEQLYGVASSLECRASEDGGARVVLRIPRRSDEANATAPENTAAKPGTGTDATLREADTAASLPESFQ